VVSPSKGSPDPPGSTASTTASNRDPRRRRALFIAAYLCSVFSLPTTLATPASQTRSSVFSMHTIVR
jgi:hypothetical protein